MSYILPNLQSARVAAGLTITQLAHRANTSDLIIRSLEDNALPQHAEKLPYTVRQEIAERIAGVLATDLETLGGVDINA